MAIMDIYIPNTMALKLIKATLLQLNHTLGPFVEIMGKFNRHLIPTKTSAENYCH